jgi:hypothetical protein
MSRVQSGVIMGKNSYQILQIWDTVGILVVVVVGMD